MAEKRMFSRSVVLTDTFIDLPMSARTLYFMYGVEADDDGFIQSPKSILRQCGCSEDDLKILIAKKYAIAFESGVIVLTHWNINNTLKNDRYKPTVCVAEKSLLGLSNNKQYYLLDSKTNINADTMEPGWNQNGTMLEPHYNLINSNIIDSKVDNSTSSNDDDVLIPSIDDVNAYAESIGYDSLDAEYFLDYYSKRHWQHKPGIAVDWKLAIKTWRKNEKKRNEELNNGADYKSRLEKANNKYSAFN